MTENEMLNPRCQMPASCGAGRVHGRSLKEALAWLLRCPGAFAVGFASPISRSVQWGRKRPVCAVVLRTPVLDMGKRARGSCTPGANRTFTSVVESGTQTGCRHACLPRLGHSKKPGRGAPDCLSLLEGRGMTLSPTSVLLSLTFSSTGATA